MTAPMPPWLTRILTDADSTGDVASTLILAAAELIDGKATAADMYRWGREIRGDLRDNADELAPVPAVSEQPTTAQPTAPAWPNWLYLTADLIALAMREGQVQVLLVRRRPDVDGAPDELAIPGGFVEPHEDCEAAARRELAEETGIAAPDRLDLLGIYDHPEHDGGVRIATVVYVGWLDTTTELSAGDDAAQADWYLLDDVLSAPMAFDHGTILRDAAARIAKPGGTPAADPKTGA